MRIRMLTSVAGDTYSLRKGQEVPAGVFSDAEAARYVEAGMAEAIEEPKPAKAKAKK